MAARAHLSIGEVLSLLREEFPDVTISKIRFLESQGLVDPERTPSGYRKFYEHDVERLRWILRQQRENFLPLKVIKGRLRKHGDNGDGTGGDEVGEEEVGEDEVGEDEVGEDEGPRAQQLAWGGPDLGNLPSPPGSDDDAAAVAGTGGPVAPPPDPAASAPGPIGPGPGPVTLPPPATTTAVPSAPHATTPADSSTGAPLPRAFAATPARRALRPEPGAAQVTAPADGPDEQARVAADVTASPDRSAGSDRSAAPDPAPTPAPTPTSVPASVPASSARGGGDVGGGVRQPAGAPVPTAASSLPSTPPAALAPAGSAEGEPAAPPAAVGTGTGAGATDGGSASSSTGGASGAPQRGPGPSADKGDGARPAPAGAATATGGRAAGRTAPLGRTPRPAPPVAEVDSYSASELAAAAGVERPVVEALAEFGLIVGRPGVGGANFYDPDALEIVRAAAVFGGHGVEARHLRAWKTGAQREASLFEQVIMPLLHQRNPDARRQALATLDELSALGAQLRQVLVRQALRDIR